ncbi:MAG: hypothetical protein RPT25_13360 [Cycloclasticus sp.]
MKALDIVHIYPGTAGSAGLYIDSIFKALSGGFSQECLVNYYFPFNYGRKIYYKVTENTGPNFFSGLPLIRLVARYFELILALFYSYFFIQIRKPKIVNYSLTSNLKIEYAFLSMLKLTTNVAIVLTCHDVVPFDASFVNFNKAKRARKKFFDIADYLLVHNENSRTDLHESYGVESDKLIQHKFPPMKLAKLSGFKGALHNKKEVSSRDEKKVVFVFVGHLRKEKGIQTLLEAWRLKKSNNSVLKISGNAPEGVAIDIGDLNGVSLNEVFLTDTEYINEIKSADYVILPYERGTNSGIPSSVVDAGAIPITSDIGMFKNNELLDQSLFFESSNELELARVIDHFACLSSGTKELKTLDLKRRLDLYQLHFESEINRTYSAIV